MKALRCLLLASMRSCELLLKSIVILLVFIVQLFLQFLQFSFAYLIQFIGYLNDSWKRWSDGELLCTTNKSVIRITIQIAIMSSLSTDNLRRRRHIAVTNNSVSWETEKILKTMDDGTSSPMLFWCTPNAACRLALKRIQRQRKS